MKILTTWSRLLHDWAVRRWRRDPSLALHLAKTLSWRLIGTLGTAAIGWLVSGDPLIGLRIGCIELIAKSALYFVHERAWAKIIQSENDYTEPE